MALPMLTPSLLVDLSYALPSRRTISAEAVGAPIVPVGGIDVRGARLDAASGGFGVVVQCADRLCKRVAELECGDQYFLLPVSNTSLREYLEGRAASLSPALGELLRRLATGTSGRIAIAGRWRLETLRFSDPNRVEITFRSAIAVGRYAPPSLDVVRSLSSATATESDFRSSLAARALLDAVEDVAAATLVDSGRGRRGPEAVAAGEADAKWPAFFTVAEELGEVVVRITASYGVAADTKRKRADVWAELADGELGVAPTGDELTQWIASGFFGEAGRALVASMRLPDRIRLVPTVSLVGRGAATTAVPEFADFEALAFHVSTPTRQALNVAFDVRPGCHGIVEDLPHFIGGSDFGVIHDEYAVERAMKHRWANYGLPRALTLERATKIQRGDRMEEATVFGTLFIGSLDVVAIDSNSDLRTDVLRLRGRGSTKVTHVRLADGRIMYAMSDEHMDFGPATENIWDVLCGLSTGEIPTDPQARAFAVAVYLDVYRHVSFPFARFPDRGIVMTYARMSSATKHIVHLGRVLETFV